MVSVPQSQTHPIAYPTHEIKSDPLLEYFLGMYSNFEIILISENTSKFFVRVKPF